MNKTILIIIVVLAVAVGGYFLLRGGYQSPAPAPMSTPLPATPSPGTEVPIIAEVRELTISGTEFSFNPSSITVLAGERVKITFKNEGRASHNLIIEGLGVATRTVGGGETDGIEFTAPASGTYTFFCSIPGHRSSGMEGQLKVE